MKIIIYFQWWKIPVGGLLMDDRCQSERRPVGRRAKPVSQATEESTARPLSWTQNRVQSTIFCISSRTLLFRVKSPETFWEEWTGYKEFTVPFCVVFFFFVFFFFLVRLDLNSGLHTWKADAVWFEPHFQSLLLWIFFGDGGLMSYFQVSFDLRFSCS
jgi:hypothetical protein